jgi:hypothetical protein
MLGVVVLVVKVLDTCNLAPMNSMKLANTGLLRRFQLGAKTPSYNPAALGNAGKVDYLRVGQSVVPPNHQSTPPLPSPDGQASNECSCMHETSSLWAISN